MPEERELLVACRSLLYKYSDEVDYQLTETPVTYQDEARQEWQEDKRQVDELLSRLSKYFEVTDGE